MVDLSEVEITQNECFVTHVYEIQLASGDALEELNAHLLREIRAIRAGGEEGIDYPGAGWQTPHDLIQRPAFAELFEAIGEVIRECARADGIPSRAPSLAASVSPSLRSVRRPKQAASSDTRVSSASSWFATASAWGRRWRSGSRSRYGRGKRANARKL